MILDEQEKNTNSFLQEYAIFQSLLKHNAENEEDDKYFPEDCISEQLPEITPFETEFQTGDIRLLAMADRIVYGVILPWDAESCLLIPCSRFLNAATDQEMLSEEHDEKGMFLQVYQCWNARTVKKALLANSWKMGQATGEEVIRLKKMMGKCWLNDSIPSDIQKLTGTPLAGVEDIRQKYMRESLDDLSSLDHAENEFSRVMDQLATPSASSQDIHVVDFNAWTQAVEEQQAAAGEEYCSYVSVYSHSEKEIQDRWIEADPGFRPVKAGEAIPRLSWFSPELPGKMKWAPVIFSHPETGSILGTGVVREANDGTDISLLYPADPEDIPNINSVKEILITVCML